MTRWLEKVGDGPIEGYICIQELYRTCSPHIVHLECKHR
jgi:hypothetical protein